MNQTNCDTTDLTDLDLDVWELARQDYGRGLSPRIIAERRGLAERTVRRRAAQDDWRRIGGVLDGDAWPDLLTEGFVGDRRAEVGDLLMHPGRDALARFAFKRATEAAAMGSPSETSAWLRVVDQLRRNVDALRRIDREVESPDVFRAHYVDHLEKSIRDVGMLTKDDG